MNVQMTQSYSILIHKEGELENDGAIRHFKWEHRDELVIVRLFLASFSLGQPSKGWSNQHHFQGDRWLLLVLLPAPTGHR